MREAIGGTMLMYIVVFFLFVYIFFMAVVINYGRVFRAKNSLISYIEAEEGFKAGGVDAFKAKASELGYTNQDIYVCYTKGNSDTKYFSIKLNIKFILPLLDEKEAAIKIPITGETSGIKNVSESNTEGIYECGNSGDKFKEQHCIYAGACK